VKYHTYTILEHVRLYLYKRQNYEGNNKKILVHSLTLSQFVLSSELSLHFLPSFYLLWIKCFWQVLGWLERLWNVPNSYTSVSTHTQTRECLPCGWSFPTKKVIIISLAFHVPWDMYPSFHIPPLTFFFRIRDHLTLWTLVSTLTSPF